MKDGSLIARFGRARRDPRLAVLEGFHPLKHALRFGARIIEAVTSDLAELERLAAGLAPELQARLGELVRPVDPAIFDQLAPITPSTGVIALAERTSCEPVQLLAGASGGERRGGRGTTGEERPLGASGPLVLLEDPRDLGNLGACVRVAAAADAGGVLSTGGHDPWHPDALRGSAGLHFALPVCHVKDAASLDPAGRALLALDAAGQQLRPSSLDPRAILAFGTERRGLSEELLERADAVLAIPMREGVSSLNLATSVAAVLFAWRLSGS